MTIEEAVKKYIVDKGVFPEEADQILVLVKADLANEAMKDRWNDHIEDYSKQALNVLYVSVDFSALAWIDKNCPKAWYRLCFK